MPVASLVASLVLLAPLLSVLCCGLPAAANAQEARGTRPAAPVADVQTQYWKIATQATAEFDAGHFAEARALFLRAHELWPSARTLRTLGMTAFELRLYPLALAELDAALIDLRRPLPEDQRARVMQLLDQTRAFVGHYRLLLDPSKAELFVDGVPQTSPTEPLVLAVGHHELLTRARGYNELRRSLVVQGGEQEELTLRLEPRSVALSRPRPVAADEAPTAALAVDRSSVHRPTRLAAFVSLGVGATGLIASGVLTGLTLRSKHRLDGKCSHQVCPYEDHDQVRAMKRLAKAATAGVIVGTIAVAAGLFLWLRGARHDRAPGLARRPFTLELSTTGLGAKF